MKKLLVLLAFVVAACGNVDDSEVFDDIVDQVDEDDAPCDAESGCRDTVQALSGLGWKLPAGVRKAGNNQHVGYDGAPAWNGGSNCSGGLTPGAKKLGEYLLKHFETYQIQGYNCRKIAGSNSMSLHGTGRALDIMIRTKPGGGARNALGDEIGNWLIKHSKEIGVQYIIWDRTQYKSYASGRKDSYYGGVSPHYDHLHVELTNKAARRNTSWFTNERYKTAPRLSARFAAGTIPNHDNRATFKLANKSDKRFDNVVFGYDVPNRFEVVRHIVWRKPKGGSSWIKVKEGGALANEGKVNIGPISPGGARRLVLFVRGDTDQPTGYVRGWVRHIDRFYKGASGWDVRPAVNRFGRRLRGASKITAK